jgi:hypothetical protein
MKVQDYRKAEKLVGIIDSIKDLTKDHNLGKISKEVSFTENNDDFQNANFIKIYNTTANHCTGGGSSLLDRLTVCKHSDKSGSKYVLSKQETIKLQEFLKNMLDERLESLEQGLSKI